MSSSSSRSAKTLKRPAESAELELSPTLPKRPRRSLSCDSRCNNDVPSTTHFISHTLNTEDPVSPLSPRVINTIPPVNTVAITEKHCSNVDCTTPSLQSMSPKNDMETHGAISTVERAGLTGLVHLDSIPNTSECYSHSEIQLPAGGGVGCLFIENHRHEEDSPDVASGSRKVEATYVQKEPKTISESLDTKRACLLPIELHALILESFWDHERMDCKSYDTLKSCALTCSRWRAAARPYIFRFLILRGPEEFDKLAVQLVEEPYISGWIHKVRLEGKTSPLQDVYRRLPENVEKDPDTSLYSFLTVLGTPLSSIRILELVGFTQVSSSREDRMAFAEWIPTLTSLTSLTALYLVRCEMSPNSLTAIVRALPALTRITLIVVDFSHPNTSVLQDEVLTTSDHSSELKHVASEPNTGEEVKERQDSTDDHDVSNANPSDTPISYPIFHPPPAIRALSIDTAPGDEYDQVKFEQFAGWLLPEALNECLESLEMGINVCPSSLNTMLGLLGKAPKLRHLQVDASRDTSTEIAHLINLRTLCLCSVDDVWEPEETIPSIQHFLSQIKDNMPHLEEVTIAVYMENEEDINDLGVLDDYLVERNFLKRIKLALWPSSLLNSRRDTFQKVKDQFPQLDKHGLLTVAEQSWLYPDCFIGIP